MKNDKQFTRATLAAAANPQQAAGVKGALSSGMVYVPRFGLIDFWEIIKFTTIKAIFL